MATIHNTQLSSFLTDVSLYAKHPQRVALKKNPLEMQRHQSGVGWVGAAVQTFLEALFLSGRHNGYVIPEKNEEEWDLVINYLCVVGV